MDSGNVTWILVSGALVLFMTPGLAFFYGGMVRSKNVLNMLMMNFWCILVVPLLWVVVGYSLSFNGSGSHNFPCLSVGSRTASHDESCQQYSAALGASSSLRW